MKKILAILLALTLVLGLGTAIFAADDKSITLTGGKAGHTYTLYQIFTGTVESGELTNIQWGSGASAAYKAAYDTAAAAAKAISDQNDARATAQQLVANSYLGTGTEKALTADGDVAFTGLAEGYYVIVDTNGNTTPVEGDYSSAYIVKVVKDVTGAIKGSGATSDKEVKDPETGSAATDDAAAYNIGDAVPFTLKATTADNVSSYQKYHITFHDTQSDGLTAPTEFTVTVLGESFTINSSTTSGTATTTNGTKITVTQVTPATGETFAIKVEFEPTVATGGAGATYLDAECNSTVITVDYTAVLNSSAEIGLPGNDNDMHITYSNNPEDDDGGDEGETPDDKVKVFTYKTVLDKVDAEGAALEGAGFTIYQEVAADSTGNYPTGAQTGSAIKTALAAIDANIEATKLADAKYYLTKAMTTVSGNDAQFEFEGLADGTYVLVETTIPVGFNPFDSVQFTISSTVKDTEITTLTGGTPFTTTNPGDDGDVTATKKDGTTHSLESGELYAEIENNSGATLPETGGIGTTIFYIVGGLLAVGAGVVLVTKKRMGKEEN